MARMEAKSQSIKSMKSDMEKRFSLNPAVVTSEAKRQTSFNVLFFVEMLSDEAIQFDEPKRR